MNARTLKGLAVALLALALAAIALSMHATMASGQLLGPSALVATPRGELWLGIDRQLWRLDAEGGVLHADDAATLGLPGAPANLVVHPSGAIVATVRDDPTLYFLDPQSARVTQRLRPQFPADLERHAARAVNLAFHADGRVAIATGGGHAVVLFDAAGRLLARTPADTYLFTNGLWWIGDALWTTDTNRFELKRLDAATLAPLQALSLPINHRARYLGPARAHPAAGASDAPMAALIRYDNAMTTGRIVLVAADDRETALAAPADMEPRDVAWLAGQVLASDGASSRVLRWSADGQALSPFGGAALHQHLQGLVDERRALQSRHRQALVAAIALFACAFALAVWAQHGERREASARAPLDLSALGTPPLTARPLSTLRLRVHGPLFAALLPVIAAQVLLRWPAVQQTLGRSRVLLAMGGLIVVVLAGVPLYLRRLRRLAQEPGLEALFNELAVRKLRRSNALSLALRDGERVLETFTLQGQAMRWAVLSDERLLVFKATLADHRLEASYEMAQIAAASTQAGALQPGRGGNALLRTLGLGGWLEIALRDGGVLCGMVSAPTVAQRVAERLNRAAGGAARGPAATPAPRVPGPRRELAALCSALVPGLGQWAQRRGAIALLLFVPWLAFGLFATLPVMHAALTPSAEVSVATQFMVAVMHAGLSAVGAWDAWRMGRVT